MDKVMKKWAWHGAIPNSGEYTCMYAHAHVHADAHIYMVLELLKLLPLECFFFCDSRACAHNNTDQFFF